jgi:hypothetical protein
LPTITAGRRAFSLTFSITQRDAAYRRSSMPTSTRCGVTGLEVVVGEVPVDAAGEQLSRRWLDLA